MGDYFAILPSMGRNMVSDYAENVGGEIVEAGFSYNSGQNPTFLSVEELRTLIVENIDSEFSPN